MASFRFEIKCGLSLVSYLNLHDTNKYTLSGCYNFKSIVYRVIGLIVTDLEKEHVLVWLTITMFIVYQRLLRKSTNDNQIQSELLLWFLL